MKTKLLFSFLVIAAMFVVTGSVSARFQSAAAAPQSVAAGTAFTYQGRLVDGGSPANGGYDFSFVLFDSEVGGDLVAGPITRGVYVTEGVFTVQLDFGAVFDGSLRYLEIGIRSPGSIAPYTVLSPRQRLDPTPYALTALSVPWSALTGTPRSDHDHWGQSWSGNDVGLTLTGGNIGLYGNGAFYGLAGSSASSVGVYGTSATGTGVSGTGTTGVEGVSNTVGGTGVYGSTLNGFGDYAGYFDGNVKVNGNQWVAGSGTALTVSTDVTGILSSGGATGVSGSGSQSGLYGTSDYGSGVHGSSTNGVGVRGTSGFGSALAGSSTDGYGVFAVGGPFGVFGQCTADGCSAVYGMTSGSGGYAGHFEGNVYVYGSFTATGTKSAAVQTQSYGTRDLYAMESPENWFEDFGTGQLVDGKALITIDPVFAQTVNLTEDYRVFPVPLGDCAMYVESKSPTSFTVRAIGGQTCSAAFDYRIVAKRLGYEDLRLAVSDQAAAGSVAPTSPDER